MGKRRKHGEQNIRRDKMTEKMIEKMVLGLDQNTSQAWVELQAQWKGGALIMPQDEMLRRKEYKALLKSIFLAEGITPETVQDTWLKGKIHRILKN